MSISSEITRISDNVSGALDAIESKGVTIPTGANSDDLPSLISSIRTGSSVVVTPTLLTGTDIASISVDGSSTTLYAPTPPTPSSATPQDLGTASSGSSTDYSRADHVHAKPSYSKSDVGLGNVDNVQQYSASNPPPYPVTSVNGETGEVSLTASDVNAIPAPASASSDNVLAYNGSAWVPDKRTVILSYGNSTWTQFLSAYNSNAVIYCRASSNSNPATGSQTRMAFMAYVNNADNPTNVEFQYYRSVNQHSATQQGDQVYVYKLDYTAGWTVTVRENYTKIVAGSGLSSSYSSGTLTLSSTVSVPTASDATPENLGTAAAGSSANYSRADHVHAMPTASDVGALPDTYTAPVDSVNGQTGNVVLSIPTDTADLINSAGFVDAAGAAAAAPVQSVNSQTGAVVLTKSDVGLGSVDNVQQYSASNPPPYPVTSVNTKTGAVTLTASDVGAGTYSKPSGGIPESDLASAVQTSLGLADTAYQKPSSGIPATDIADGVIPTVPYSIGNGGTGASNANTALTNLKAFNLDIGMAIPNSSDLNTYTTPGVYYCSSGTDAATLTNVPNTSSGFKLIVMYQGSTVQIRQIAMYNAADRLYERYRTSAADGWNSWKGFVHTGYLPLSVGNGGTGLDTLTANAVLTGNGTSAVTPVATAKGAFYATSANGAPTFGTLPVAEGGTGRATITSNAILAGNTTSAVKMIATARGALYATEANGAPAFGTLPVAEGGTGSTTLTANAILAGNGTSALNKIATASGALYATAANGAASFGTLPIAQGGTGGMTVVTKNTTSTSNDAITAEYTVSGSGIVIAYAGIYSNTNNDYGTWQAEIYYDGTLIMGEGSRLTTANTQRYGASTSVPIQVTNGKKIKITLLCTKGGTKNIFRRFLCFGCTVS